MTFWYDGQLYTETANGISMDAPGLKFGATVFTTLRVHGDSLEHPLTQWQAHCDRLHNSLKAFQWTAPHWPTLYKGCQQLKRDYPILRMTLFPDGREWITGRQLPEQRLETTPQGVACWVAPPTYARSLPTHKTGNYLACWLARQKAQRSGAHEAILTNAQGDWLETSTGNLWGWRRHIQTETKSWHSPAGDHCLPGIMRHTIERILVNSGQTVHCQPWAIAQLSSFEAVAYSNCAVGLLPIHTITNGTTTLEYNPNHASIKALQHQLTQLAKS